MVNKKIFITCPAYHTTGGFELLHQLVYKLNKIEQNCAVIYYHNFDSKRKEHPTPEIYMKYTKGKYVSKIDDDSRNVLILPEVYTDYIQRYRNLKFVVWWLSVDYFFISIDNINKGKKLNYKDFKKGKKFQLYRILNWINIKPDNKFNPFTRKILFNDRILVHAFQSNYAGEFLDKNKLIPKLPLSDFLNSTFFNNQISIHNRENVILYNPNKGIEVTSVLIELLPEFRWIALQNYTPFEMRNLMLNSKVYIDFGNHPGKDRIPREAALNGCVVITNKEGSAKYFSDVSIDDKYKFENPIEEVNKLKGFIENIFSEFTYHYNNFNDYRDKIKDEEKMFDSELEVFYDFLMK